MHHNAHGATSHDVLSHPGSLDGRDPPGVVAGEKLRRRSPAGCILEIDIRKLLAVVVADDKRLDIIRRKRVRGPDLFLFFASSIFHGRIITRHRVDPSVVSFATGRIKD